MAGEVVKVAEEVVLKAKDIIPYLWAVVSALFGSVAFLFWRIFNGMDKKINEKVNKDVCVKAHENIDSALHTHAKSGHAGEVVDR